MAKILRPPQGFQKPKPSSTSTTPRSKGGKPKAIEREEEQDQRQKPEEFVKEFFPAEKTATGEEIGSSTAQHQEGLTPIVELKKMFQTKSAAIRYLHSELGGSHPPKVIAKHLGIKYQHARNVCTTQLKRGPNEDWRPPHLRIPLLTTAQKLSGGMSGSGGGMSGSKGGEEDDDGKK